MDGVVTELQADPLGFHQCLILPRQAGIGAGQDAFEVTHAEALQFDPNWKAALQFGNQIGRPGQMKRTAGDEQDVVGLDHADLGRDGGAFDQRQQVALHTLARDIRSAAFAAGDLVDLVKKDYAVRLDITHGFQLDFFLVDEAPRFFVSQLLHRLGNLQLAFLGTLLTQVLEHALQLRGEFFHAGRRKDFHLCGRHRQIKLDFLVVKLALAQHLAEFLPRGGFLRLGCAVLNLPGITRARQQHVEDAVLGGIFRAHAHLARGFLARLLDGDLGQVADDAVDILADIADFGELGRFHLDERRARQTRQSPRDLGLADAGGSDHQNVLGRDFLSHDPLDPHPPPAVAQRDGAGALGGILSDDVFIEFMHDFLRRHLRHLLLHFKLTAFKTGPNESITRETRASARKN